MLLLFVSTSLQQFAAGSILNAIPPSIALAAVINSALPQPHRVRSGPDEEAGYDYFFDIDEGAVRNPASSTRPSQSSSVGPHIQSVRLDCTNAPDDDPDELEPSSGDRSDYDRVPGDDSTTS